MEYAPRSGSLAKARTQCLVVPVFENTETGRVLLGSAADTLNSASNGQIRKVINRGDIAGKAGQTLLLHDVANVNSQRVLLIGCGSPANMDPGRFINVARAIIGTLKPLSIKNALCCLAELDCVGKSVSWKVQRLIEQFEAGCYSFTEMKGTGNGSSASSTLERIEFFSDDRAHAEEVIAGIVRGRALAAGMSEAKDVANTPGNICTPSYMETKARALADRYDSLSIEVLEESQLEELGMGAFLSVSRGSDQPAKFIILQHRGADKAKKPHVLVGKGITFDTGGISLKTAASMHEMIYDMSGAASVLGTVAAIAEQELAINLVGVLACAENMPSGNASRPGDIVTTMSGQTVEILNTDAEGRLVLCDALSYVARYEPETVVDVATLTGAIVTSLGAVASGLFSNDDDLANDLATAGENSHDRVWRLPIWEDYQPQLSSAFADMANIGGKEAGSITAACFLARFSKQYRWAHLDIAGTGYKGSGSTKGCTGRPVPLLTEYLNSQVSEYD